MAEELIEVQWETVVRHRAVLTAEQIHQRLGHAADRLQHRPIIDAELYFGAPGEGFDASALYQALGSLESDAGEPAARTITYVEPQQSS